MKDPQDFIRIRGARVHNLKNVDIDIPRNKLVVLTGISGSGKSSLAFDTIYADGQRRYVESLSAYARQFLGMMEKPDVDSIEGISPAISIDQKSVSKNPRSTVGTITEIYDYLRLLFSRIGHPHCPKCGRPVSKQSASRIVEKILSFPKGSSLVILAPLIRGRKGEHRSLLEEVERAGFSRVRVNREIMRVEEVKSRELERYKMHTIEVVVDRLEVARDPDTRLRVASSVEVALKMGHGLLVVQIVGNVGNVRGVHTKQAKRSNISNKSNNSNKSDILFSEHFSCTHCDINLPELEPRTFSFNSPHGACPKCTGIGYQLEFDPELVVPNPRLTIAEGAIRPWMHASHRVGRQSWYWWTLSDLAEGNRFSLHTPWEKLSLGARELILHGGGEFEGVIPNLGRRYKETESDWTRQELEQYMIIHDCPECKGKRLRKEALAVTVSGQSIDRVAALSIKGAQHFFASFVNPRAISYNAVGYKATGKKRYGVKALQLTANEMKIAKPIVREVLNRLQFLVDVGLDYLTLDRSSVTLAGGEAQRIRLATQIGTKLVGVLYILDEPSVGLHARDQGRLIQTLKGLRDLGNTVLVVEHDPQTIRAADWVIDVGPGAGKHGGRIVFEGSPRKLLGAKTITGEYLSGRRFIQLAGKQESKLARKQVSEKADSLPRSLAHSLVIRGAREHNLKNIDAKIPLGMFVCITGVSGSGKSSLMNDILAKALLKHFYHAKEQPGAHDRIEGIEHVDKAILIDQSPIGRTPRSNPATYTSAFTTIRDLFAQTREARIRGYSPGRFSFNVKGGRCESCQGEGLKRIEMQFLPDVYVECEECGGKRFNKEALEIEYNGKNIAEVLEMTIEEATRFFSAIPALYAKLGTLNEVGLGYMELGQPATMLSGGEAQRVKLATELSRRATGKTLYILDEPTTGLHPYDIEKLLNLLAALVEKGNTVLVIEHNLDVIKNADWIVDLGLEGGEGGGEIVAEGPPEGIAKVRQSYTGQYLKKL